MQRPDRLVPVEPGGLVGRGMVLAPEDPGREDAVEERLHEGRAEEVCPLVPLELDAEGLLQRIADGVERGQLAAGGAGLGLDAGLGVAGVGGEEPGDVLGHRQRGGVQHHPLQVLDEPPALLVGDLVRQGRRRPEGRLARGELERLKPGGVASASRPTSDEVAVVGDEHLAVEPQVLRDLLRLGDGVDVVARPLDLDRPARGQLPLQDHRLARPLELVRREQPAVGNPRALVGEVDDAADLRPERLTDLVQQVRQRPIIRSLLDPRAEERMSRSSRR